VRHSAVRIILVGLIALPWIACKKSQPSITTMVGPVAVKPAAEPLRGAKGGESTHFTGEVRRGDEFKQLIGPGMEFRLEPYAGNDSGWSIRLAPGTDANARTMDCIGAVEEPLHGNTRLEIEPLENGKTPDVSWKTRGVSRTRRTILPSSPTSSGKKRVQGSAKLRGTMEDSRCSTHAWGRQREDKARWNG